MLKRNILVGFLFLFSLNVSANDASLAKEAKKYKTLKELCLKSKEWSSFGRIANFIHWDSSCKFNPAIHQLKPSIERYSALAPYVFANMKPGNVFFTLQGFSFSHATKNNRYSILLINKDIKKDELIKIYADFNKKYKKIDFKSERENRDLNAVKKRQKWIHETLKTSKSDYEESLRKAIPTNYTWDTTTYRDNGNKIIIKITSVVNSRASSISGSVSYISN